MSAASAVATGLAGRYATALFDLAREQNGLERVGKDLDQLGAMIAASVDLRRLIDSPVLSRDEQGQAIGAVAKRAEFDGLTVRFLGLLAEKRRLFVLPDIVKAFSGLLAAHRGEVAAEVVSAVPLEGGQLDAVKEAVGAYAGKRVNVTTRVDPGILGGLVVRIGSRMVDTSLRSKLQQLELAMKGVR